MIFIAGSTAYVGVKYRVSLLGANQSNPPHMQLASAHVSSAHSLVAVLYYFDVRKNTLSMVVEIFGSCCSSIG